jgi:hypothetical protein
MDVTATNDDHAHELNAPQYWVFTWSLPTATYSSKQGTAFARHIHTSIKKSYDAKTRIFIKVQVIHSSKPVLELRGMIWTSVDEDLQSDKGELPHPTIEDLQDRVRRQARRAELEIVDKEVLRGLELNLLSNKVAAGNWAYTSLDNTMFSSSFFGDQEFVYLITVSSLNRVIIRGLFLKLDGL